MSRLSIECLTGLPAGIAMLRADAVDDGHRAMSRLVEEWADGSNRFDRPGECLFAVCSDRMLAGIGGLTIEPTGASMFRMRRLYVHTTMRRHGVGRLIVETLLDHVQPAAAVVTVNAGTPDASAFWLRMGFLPCIGREYTHIFAFT
jgi:GNAT superfamily N-acetyltransferase